VVTVITYDKEKNLSGQGSGFFVDPNGHVITNHHVLEGAYTAEVKTSKGEKYSVEMVLAENKDADLVKILVNIPKEKVKFINVSETVPEIAERILVVGSPLGLDQTVHEGIVSAVREIPTILSIRAQAGVL
jgi:S1-C subfamily serine protease